MAAKIGDRVRFLNDVGGGTVVNIKGNMAYVADDDGFETPMLLKECIVVASGDTPAPSKEKEVTSKQQYVEALAQPTSQPQPDDIDVTETAYGDKINVTLAFEAHDLKRLSQTAFDMWLVNDSNYYLYFALLRRADSVTTWTTVYAGMVEPNLQLPVAEFETSDLYDFEYLAVQMIAFKQNMPFDKKAPIAYESKIDLTKFAKLHCFKQNIYFDNPVIAFDIVKDDKLCSGATEITALFDKPVNNLHKQAKVERRPHMSRRAQKHDQPLVTDLHASELLDTLSGLSNADILNYQIDTFRKVMDDNLRHYGRKLIFIHGKGDGVLRKAILKELNYRYRFCSVQDASFKEYGYGATQVTINRQPSQR